MINTTVEVRGRTCIIRNVSAWGTGKFYGKRVFVIEDLHTGELFRVQGRSTIPANARLVPTQTLSSPINEVA